MTWRQRWRFEAENERLVAAGENAKPMPERVKIEARAIVDILGMMTETRDN
jgi:hypothetical protein